MPRLICPTNQAPHPSHPSPRLRTKTGCLTCRDRKKKCDEQRPSCGDCSKFARACLWPSVLTDRRNGLRKSRSNSSSLSAPVSATSTDLPTQCSLKALGGFQQPNWPCAPYGQIIDHYPFLTSRRERMLFHHFVTCYMPRCAHPAAHPMYALRKEAYQLGFQMPEVMSIYLAIAALHIAQDDDNAALVATHLYNSSVCAVWSRMSSGEVDGTEEWLFMLTHFMVLFEVSRFHVSCEVMLHLEGLGKLFKIRKANSVFPDPQKTFPRVIGEAFTYHLATSSLLNAGVDHIAEQFTWADLNAYENSTPFPDASEIANSPILGSPVELYHIIFGITRLSRHTPLKRSDQNQATNYKNQLDKLQREMSRSPSRNEIDEDKLRRGALLYILASQLFSFKVLNPEIDSADQTVRYIMTTALTLLQNCEMNTGSCSYFCWPLTVLACAVQYEEEVQLIKAKLAEIWQLTLSGQIYRTIRIVNSIWDAERFGCQSFVREGRPSYGLDRLIHKNGLIDTLGNFRATEIDLFKNPR